MRTCVLTRLPELSSPQEKNLRFAAVAEPHNEAVQQQLETTRRQLRDGEHSVPSTIAGEWSFNPFMRVQEETLRKYTGRSDPVRVSPALARSGGTLRALRPETGAHRPSPVHERWMLVPHLRSAASCYHVPVAPSLRRLRCSQR